MSLFRREFLALLPTFFGLDENFPGCALLWELRSKRALVMHGAVQAREWLVEPGSTMKPLSWWALLRSGKVKPGESLHCVHDLRLAGLRLNCSHPRLPFPVDATRAIAYSCNCATAYFARRFTGDELARCYQEFGLESATQLLPEAESVGHIQKNTNEEQVQLQALGERGLRVTALEVAKAYGRLAGLASDPKFAPVLAGMEGAVQFGTGQAAQVPGRTIAGKTGSVQTEPGLRAAWFAGFAPSRQPEVVVTVLTQGRSGAEAAAPIAGKLLRHYFAADKF